MAGRNPSHGRVADNGREGEGAVAAHRGEWQLPMANLVRAMRKVLPENARISESAKQLLHDSALEFARFLVNEAAEERRWKHRRTVAPEHLVQSLEDLGFDDYVEPMSVYIRRYAEAVGGRANRNAAVGGSRAPLPSFTAEELKMLTEMLAEPLSDDDGETN